MQNSFTFVEGGVAAAEGFTASGVLNKIKANRTTYDTALIFSDTICNAAGVFTQNRVKAECVKFTKKQIEALEAQVEEQKLINKDMELMLRDQEAYMERSARENLDYADPEEEVYVDISGAE